MTYNEFLMDRKLSFRFQFTFLVFQAALFDFVKGILQGHVIALVTLGLFKLFSELLQLLLVLNRGTNQRAFVEECCLSYLFVLRTVLGGQINDMALQFFGHGLVLSCHGQQKCIVSLRRLQLLLQQAVRCFQRMDLILLLARLFDVGVQLPLHGHLVLLCRLMQLPNALFHVRLLLRGCLEQLVRFHQVLLQIGHLLSLLFGQSCCLRQLRT